MRMYRTIAWFLLSGCASAQSHSPAQTGHEPQTEQQTAPASSPAAQPSKIDLAKAAEIRQLMEVTGAKAIVIQMMDSMGDSLKPMLTNALPPGEYRDKLVDPNSQSV
jgi:hypothetical protein